MLCENCQQREASVHVKQSHNNQITEYDLCSVCAQEMEQGGYSSFNDIFGGLFNSMFWGPAGFSYPQQRVQPQERLQCPNCGLTESELLKRGFLGCPQCYEVFEEKLNPVFQRVQGHTSQALPEPLDETGTINANEVLPEETADPLAQLREKQQNAIAREDYEKAAQLRDEIKELEKIKSDEIKQENPEDQDESGAEEEEK